MQSLGPHTIMRITNDGEEQEIHVTVYFTGHEAWINGICIREGGSVYRNIAGDVKKPGDMFL
jgi:hypothetical protein